MNLHKPPNCDERHLNLNCNICMHFLLWSAKYSMRKALFVYEIRVRDRKFTTTYICALITLGRIELSNLIISCFKRMHIFWRHALLSWSGRATAIFSKSNNDFRITTICKKEEICFKYICVISFPYPLLHIWILKRAHKTV